MLTKKEFEEANKRCEELDEIKNIKEKEQWKCKECKLEKCCLK